MLYKSMEINVRAHPECIYASNPYHECAGSCLEKIAQRKGAPEKKKPNKLLSFSGSFGRKKHANNFSAPAKGYQNGDGRKPIYTEEFRVFKSFPDYGRIANESPKTPAKQETKSEPTLTENTRSFDIFGLKQLDRSSESEEDELQSVISESLVSVGRYHIKSDVSAVLETIIAKHGDVAANCQLASASMRTRYLECLCSVVQELKSTAFEDLTKSRLKEMVAIVKDVESVKVEVGWLKGTLEELMEAMEMQHQLRTLEEEKASHDLALDEAREELELCMKDLARREKEVVEAKARLTATRTRLDELELESPKLEQSVSSIQPKVDRFRSKNVIDELL